MCLFRLGPEAAMTEILTAERLRDVLHYDPGTGVFTWRVRTARCVHVGDVAGMINVRRIRIDGRLYKASRLAWLYMTGEFPVSGIDHTNLIRADDRFCNLREATASQNQANAPMRKDGKSGFKGVHRRKNKWVAEIQVNGKQIFLGSFDTPERAFIEYCFAAWRHFGDHARIDADYLVELRRLKARKAFERTVLWNLANPNPNYMAA
jgi:hypothetical protein